jgi:hypothetical protein
MARRLLIPRELTLSRGDLYAGEDLPPGTCLLPWDGVLRSLAPEDEAHDCVTQGDPRLFSGLVDTPQLVNWVRYLAPLHPHQLVANHPALIGSTGPMGEPMFTAVRAVSRGERLTAVYEELPEVLLRHPAVLLLRSALHQKYVERAAEEQPIDLTARMADLRKIMPAAESFNRVNSSSVLSSGFRPHLELSFGSESPRSDGYDKISEEEEEELDGGIVGGGRCSSTSSPDSLRFCSDEEPSTTTAATIAGLHQLYGLKTFEPSHHHHSSNSEHRHEEHERLYSSSVVATTKGHKFHNSHNNSKRMLPCNTCGKVFDRPSLLERHVRIHTGERPYVCDYCQKGFSTSSSLNTHRRIHTGEKPHVCKTCGKCFTASSNLYYHRMTHLKVSC